MRHFKRNGQIKTLFFLCVFYLVYFYVKTDWEKKYENVTNNKTQNFIVYSSYYYIKSKLYSPNSMVILLNIHKHFDPKSINLECYSQNKTATLISKVQIRIANIPAIDCKWEFFIANCSTLSNPTLFGFTTSATKKVLELNFESPIQDKKYPVAMCYPPMVYESRWQQIIFATEIYHYFRTDLQIQYINSAMKEIVDILEIYQSKGWIKIQPFAFFDFVYEDVENIGMNPALELHARNLPLAFTDCLMRYRESSEFIIIADVDDILFPKRETFFDEFLHLKNKYPTAAGFMYHRSYAKIDVANDFHHFSLSETIQSLKVAEPIYFGKTVYQTEFAETAWIHNPGLNNDSTITVPSNFGRMFHVQIEDSKIRKVNDTYFFGEKEDVNNFNSFTPIPNKDIEKIMYNFILSFKHFPNFPSNNIYTDILFECNKKHEIWSKYLPCLTPFQCVKPTMKANFKCITAKRNYFVKFLNNNLAFYLPSNEHFWESRNDGCHVLTNSS